MTGGETHLDITNREVLKSLIKASKGIPLYFLQQYNLKGENCLAFFDSGAMFYLNELNLTMIGEKTASFVNLSREISHS